MSDDEIIAYEPVPVPEIFVTGVLPVEDLGGLFRLTLVSDRRTTKNDVERVIVSRIVIPLETLDTFANRWHSCRSETDNRRTN